MNDNTYDNPMGMGSTTDSAAGMPPLGSYRASRIIDSDVVNDANDTIGTIEDLIISTESDKALYALISVGGFLGMGSRVVAVPFNQLRLSGDNILLPGATKEELQSMPEFET